MSLPIHGHPQKASYDDPSQWPTMSAQTHWLDPMGMPQHTHVDLKFPLYAELAPGVPITVAFTLTLFHVNGQIGRVTGGNRKTNDATNWHWNDTNSGTPPAMVGDPTGIRTWSGTFDVTPFAAFGWEAVSLQALTLFANGDATTTTNSPPFFGPDASQGVASGPNKPILMCESTIDNQKHANADPFYGIQTAQWDGMLPLTAISQPWPDTFSTYGYGNRALSQASVTELRLDMDLHNGIQGTVLASTTSIVEETHVPFVLDPAQIGPGPHKIAILRFQSNGAEQVTSLLVVTVTVDPNAPTPDTVKVPNVIGMTEIAASAALVGTGLVVGQTNHVANDAAIGLVLMQSVMAGMTVLKGTIVSLTVSSGPVIEPPPTTDRIVLGTIELRPDGSTCVCSVNGTVEMENGQPCVILHPPPTKGM